MKYSKLLESISKGINLALDDFDFNSYEQNNQNHNDIIDSNDDEKLQFCKHIILPKMMANDTILHFYYALCIYNNNLIELKKYLIRFGLKDIEANILIDYLKAKNIINREYVDLGLASGTLWCTENLGKMDYKFKINGKDLSADNGSWYVWGETEPNKIYNQDYIKLKKQYIDKFTFTNKSKKHVKLDLKDDAAYAENKHYRIPTSKQFEELFNETNHYSLKFDDYANFGYVMVSKKDPLNFIWFPYEKICQYLTSEIVREKSLLGLSSRKMILKLKFIKLVQENDLIYRTVGYQLATDDTCIPIVYGKIRPIYKK